MVGKKKPLPPKGMINVKPTKFKKQKKQHGGATAADYSGDPDSKDFYKVLGVARNASEVDIIKAYRNGSLKFHPDNHTTGDKDIMAKLNEAKETLIDSTQREEYNKKHPQTDILTRASNALNNTVANIVAVTPATDKQQKVVTPVAVEEIQNAMTPATAVAEIQEGVISTIEPAAATEPSPIVAFTKPPLVFDSVELYMFLNILVHFIYINKDDDYRIPYFIKEVPIPLQSGALVTTTPFDINLLKTNIFADILREAQSAMKNSVVTATTLVADNVKKLKVFKNGLNLWVENNRSILRIKNINVITTSITNIVSNILLTKERPYKLIKSTFTIMDFLNKKSDVKDSSNIPLPPKNIKDIKDIPALVTFLNEIEYIKVTEKFVKDNETKLQVNIEQIEELVNSRSKPSTKYTVSETTGEPLGNLKILIEEVIKQVKASSYVEKTATIASTHPIIYNNLYWRNKRSEISTFLGNIYIRINGMERIRDYIDKKLKEANSKAKEALKASKALEDASKKPSEEPSEEASKNPSEERLEDEASKKAFNNFIKKINNEIELATKVTNAATASEDAERALYIDSIFITYVEVNRIINKTKKLKAKRLEIQQKLIKLYDNFKIEKPKPQQPQPSQQPTDPNDINITMIDNTFIENNKDDLKEYINTIKKEYVLNKNTKDAISTLRVVLTSTDSRITTYGAIKTITYSKQADSEFPPDLTKKMMQDYVKNDNSDKKIDTLFNDVINNVPIMVNVNEDDSSEATPFPVYSISQLQNKDEDTKIKEAFENVFNTDSYANTLKIKTVAEKVRVYAQNARISIAEAIKTFIENNELNIENNELNIENIISLTKISEQVAEKAIKAATDSVEFSTKKSEEEAKKSKMVKTKISTEKKDENEEINEAKVSLKKAQLKYDNEVKDAEYIYKIATLNKNTENVKNAKGKAEKVYKLATEVAEKATFLYDLLAKEAIKSPAKVAEAGATYADAVARYYSDNHESFDYMPDIASILKVIDTFKEILGDTYFPKGSPVLTYLKQNYANIYTESNVLAITSSEKVTNQLKTIIEINKKVAQARKEKAEKDFKDANKEFNDANEAAKKAENDVEEAKKKAGEEVRAAKNSMIVAVGSAAGSAAGRVGSAAGRVGSAAGRVGSAAGRVGTVVGKTFMNAPGALRRSRAVPVVPESERDEVSAVPTPHPATETIYYGGGSIGKSAMAFSRAFPAKVTADANLKNAEKKKASAERAYAVAITSLKRAERVAEVGDIVRLDDVSAFAMNYEQNSLNIGAIRAIDNKYFADFKLAKRRFVERFFEIVKIASSVAEFESIKANKAKILADWIQKLANKFSKESQIKTKLETEYKEILNKYKKTAKETAKEPPKPYTIFYDWIKLIITKNKTGFGEIIKEWKTDVGVTPSVFETARIKETEATMLMIAAEVGTNLHDIALESLNVAMNTINPTEMSSVLEKKNDWKNALVKANDALKTESTAITHLTSKYNEYTQLLNNVLNMLNRQIVSLEENVEANLAKVEIETVLVAIDAIMNGRAKVMNATNARALATEFTSTVVNEYEEELKKCLKNATAYEEKAKENSIADFSMNTSESPQDISPSDEQNQELIDYTKIENIVTTSVKTLDKVIQLYSHEHTKTFLKNYNEILIQLKKKEDIHIYDVYDIYNTIKTNINTIKKEHNKILQDAITVTKNAKTQITNYSTTDSTTDIQNSMRLVSKQIESIHKELHYANELYPRIVKNITDKFKNVKPPLNLPDNVLIKDTFKNKTSLNKDDLELLRIFIKKYNFYLPQKDTDKNLYTELNNKLFDENMMMNYVRGMLSEYDDKEITTRIEKHDNYSKRDTIKEKLEYINEDLKTTVENYLLEDNFKIVYNKYKDSLMNDVLKK